MSDTFDYINLYTGVPTEGKEDGVLVSKNGLQTSPVETLVDAATENFTIFPLAVRCQKNWHAWQGCKVYTEGDTKNQWLFGMTLDGEFASELNIKTDIKDKNVVFYVKCSAKDELPKKDESVSIIVDAEVEFEKEQ